MAPKRPRDNANNNDEEQDKITWISEELYEHLNDNRQSGREQLNARLAAYALPQRPVRSILRPRGEAGRKSATSNAGHRNGFTLTDVLKRESNVDADHYAIIQDTVHRLAARHLDIRRTWRENLGEEMVTVCIQAAKLHPCLYDYDAFWPVHDHLKRHLVSTRDKYSYVDPDLVALYDAEAAARGEIRPPPRKKRRTVGKSKQCSPPRSPSLSLSASNDSAIDVGQLALPLQQPQPLLYGHPQPAVQHDLYHQVALHPAHRSSPQQSLQVQPAHLQKPDEHLGIEMRNPPTNNNVFLNTLRDKLVAKGHSVDNDLPLRPQVWKILLGVKQFDAAEYDGYVRKGRSFLDDYIRKEIPSLLKHGGYASVSPIIQDEAWIRLANAFVWRWAETKRRWLSFEVIFRLALTFLYTTPSEAEAFYCLEKFVERCPMCIKPVPGGRNSGVVLLDRCLEYLDNDLHAYLQSNSLSIVGCISESVTSFSECGQPWEQVAKLWDLFLSQGLHLCRLAAVSRMLLARDSIMGGKHPREILVDSPTLDAEPIIRLTLELEQRLPSNLLHKLKKHLVEDIGDNSEDDV